MIDGVDDVWMWGEEGVGFCFFEGEGDGFLAEGAADLFEGVELRGGGVLDEIHVGEAALEEVLVKHALAFMTIGKKVTDFT